MNGCTYPRCYSCKLEYCIKDNVIQPKKVVDRSEYHKKRYQEHKEDYKERYTSQVQYLKWVDVKKTINRLKKQIGTNNYDLIMGEIEKLEKSKYGQV
jgi:ABC-type methionine transport system ATPase subunit